MDTPSWQRGSEITSPITRSLSRAALMCLMAGRMLLAPHEAAAQQFTFRHYQQNDGLGNLSVACLLQDHEGFIWACTENGLYRYDGVDFERFGEKQGIDGTTIRAVIEDSSGKLWVATSEDLYQSDGLEFSAVRPEGRHLRLAAGLPIAALSPEKLLVIDDDQLLELNYTTAAGHWQSRLFFPQSVLNAIPALAHVGSVHVDRMDRIWLGCGNAICRVEQGAVRIFDASRQHGTPLAVAIIDVDHFKSINDSRGHLAGDEVLRTLGAKLQTRVRSADALGRYGGEEFLLVVPCATIQRPFLPLERLQRAIAEIPFSYAGSPIKVTASFGVAWLIGDSDTAEKLLGRADEALYSAKHAGRNRVEYAATG